MEDRVAIAAKLVSEFDGTIEFAEKILEEVAKIRGEIRQEITMRTKEINAIEGLTDYILTKRNVLAHDNKPTLKQTIIMTTKKERVEAVMDAARDVVQDGIPIFDTQDIERQLDKVNIDLRVSYPPAVIATILTADKRFKKNKQGLYEYIGKERGRKTK